ncbi:XDD3 family exosortase-dependent surface protein [Baaleninema simplex]|uniref:XDD3 family exosortase-dependent surface protein n=1 Tax=Baaleninema simplex TaxID=2862350 RepID=UPI0003479C20|nr:XDD3 family exosortase-dependent surface protein [Baaleninema simplex]
MSFGKIMRVSAIAVGTVATLSALSPAARAGSLWTYQADSFTDKSGDNSMEVFGMAYRDDGDTVTFALNGNMPLGGSYQNNSKVKDRHINWGDLFINLNPTQTINQSFQTGEVLGIRFDGTNDSGIDGDVYSYSSTPGETGVYMGVTGKSVAGANHGYSSLTDWEKAVRNPNYGDASLDKNYFGDSNAKNVINSYDRRLGDINLISDTSGLELDWAGNIGGQGSNTIAFSFDRSLLGQEATEWIAHAFLECFNDGVGMTGTFAAIPDEPGDVADVPEPSMLMALGLMGLVAVKSRRQQEA